MMRRVSWIMSAGLLALAGCEGDGLERVSVRGNVTFDGAALEEGTISLVPQPGTDGPSVGTSIERGSYALSGDKGPVPGKYRVEIRAVRKTGRKIPDSMRPPPDNLIDEIEQFIPRRYNTDSTLTARLQPGQNDSVDFELTVEEDK